MNRTLEDLRHVLHDQAEATREWPAPRLRTRRTTRGRAVLLVAAATAVVVAVLVALPSLLSSSRPRETPVARATDHPTASPSPGTQDWRAVRCTHDDRLGCSAPYVMRSGGFTYGPGTLSGSVSTRYRQVLSPVLTDSLRKAGTHWVLVGAIGSGTGSRLQFRVGDGEWRAVPSGRLSLVTLETERRGERIAVREMTRPLPRETLVVLDYLERRPDQSARVSQTVR